MAHSKITHLKTPKAHEFDSIVIGGGLTGLIAANQLESTGRKVALIESLDTLGGTSRPNQTAIGITDHTFKFFPETEVTDDLLNWFESIIGAKIERELIEDSPITYDDGKFKPFIGFGAGSGSGGQKVETAFEIDAYAQSRYFRLSTTPKDWIPQLISSFTGTVLTKSVVTKLIVEDGFVIELVVNGAKRLSGREVLYCARPQQLLQLLPETHLPVRIRQKLAKGEFWTSVNLDLIHRGKVTDSKAVHVLKGANEEPCVGIFHPATQTADGETAQLSQWLTFVPRDVTNEAEIVAPALKQIKRQVKRAFENSLDGLIKERIVVSPTSHGDLTGLLGEDAKWPKLDNLWAISSFLDPHKNTLGALRQARRTLASIAGEPVAVVAHDTDLAERPQPTV